MVDRDEALVACNLVEPGSDCALIELDDAMAANAKKMVVVSFRAEAVAHLTWPVCKGVDHAAFAEERDRSVDGCQPDPFAAVAETRVDFLRRRVGRLSSENLQHT